jgi:2-dehydro-3-deoxyphosphogluconate aldolase/(4S)-4-hydroxy-2-oxoglutarate aldolase
MTVAQARAAVEAGASFLLAPVVDPMVIAAARDLDVVAVPGTSTPTEMWTADRAGAQVVKLFPAAEKGPEFVRACLGPLPHLRIFPTSGITEANAIAFLEAGAFAVGFVAALFEREEMAAGRYDLIEERARRMVGVVRAWTARTTRG